MKRSLYMRLNNINQARNISVFLLIGILLITQDKALAVIATLLFIAVFCWTIAAEKRIRAQLNESVMTDGVLIEQKIVVEQITNPSEPTEPKKLTAEEAHRTYEWLITNAGLPLDVR